MANSANSSTVPNSVPANLDAVSRCVQTIIARGLGLACIRTPDGYRWAATKCGDRVIESASGSTYLGVTIFSNPVEAVAEAERVIVEGEARQQERAHTSMIDALSAGEYVPWPEPDGSWSVLRASDEEPIVTKIAGVREALSIVDDLRAGRQTVRKDKQRTTSDETH